VGTGVNQERLMSASAATDGVVNHPAIEWKLDGSRTRLARELAAEAAIGLMYDSRPYVVVMGSPTDVEDLATGFTVTERVAAFADIVRVSVWPTPDGLMADVLLSPLASRAVSLARRRTLESRSSCGLCGVESLREAVRPIRPVGAGPSVSPDAVQLALRALETRQVLGRLTHATHAAAWAEASGQVRLVREDVGRHNALDKLIGAALRAGFDPATAFVIVTSRCSYEMVEKTAAAGVSVLVAISAPTDLAIRQAEAAGMTLIALARADGHTVFTGHQRIMG